MKESTMYQHFVREAREEVELKGELKGKFGALIYILNDRFGEVPPQIHSRFQAVTDPATLDAAILQSFKIKSLDELV